MNIPPMLPISDVLTPLTRLAARDVACPFQETSMNDAGYIIASS